RSVEWVFDAVQQHGKELRDRQSRAMAKDMLAVRRQGFARKRYIGSAASGRQAPVDSVYA
ncbi:hypothetical protein KIPB_017236, partial [Kipferlia bialata]